MIGTIRKVLTALLEGCGHLSDEVLVTQFCEVESMINGRPLTKVSDDPTDPAALTPIIICFYLGVIQTFLCVLPSRMICTAADGDIFRVLLVGFGFVGLRNTYRSFKRDPNG